MKASPSKFPTSLAGKRLSLSLLAFLGAIFLGAMSPAAVQAATAPVILTIKVAKEVRKAQADGTTSIEMVPADKAAPGDRLLYTLTYTNTGQAPIADLVVDYPLPDGIAYRAAADGSLPPVNAGDKAAKDLRWQVAGQLAPGASGHVAFKATLN